MTNYCAFSIDHKCIKCLDYELIRHELEKSDELFHDNWIVIKHLRNYIKPVTGTAFPKKVQYCIGILGKPYLIFIHYSCKTFLYYSILPYPYQLINFFYIQIHYYKFLKSTFFRHDIMTSIHRRCFRHCCIL